MDLRLQDPTLKIKVKEQGLSIFDDAKALVGSTPEPPSEPVLRQLGRADDV